MLPKVLQELLDLQIDANWLTGGFVSCQRFYSDFVVEDRKRDKINEGLCLPVADFLSFMHVCRGYMDPTALFCNEIMSVLTRSAYASSRTGRREQHPFGEH